MQPSLRFRVLITHRKFNASRPVLIRRKCDWSHRVISFEVVQLLSDATEAHMKPLAALIAIFGLTVVLTGPAQAAQKGGSMSSQPKFVNTSTPSATFKHCANGAHYKTVTISMRKAGTK
jgi:hypothetical protein